MNTPQHAFIPGSLGYALAMSAGILIGAILWHRRARGQRDMLLIFVGALVGAFAGAKVAYLFAEGVFDWPRDDCWLRLATGKSVLGGLLGGYAGVELAKWLVGHRASTGDAFALLLPLGLALGRVGCLFQGCCLGTDKYAGVFAIRDAQSTLRWPAPITESVFQLTMFGFLSLLHRRGLLRERLIFFYFVAYGLFRFAHEFMRATPILIAGLTGYQLLALLIAGIGGVQLVRRRPLGSHPPEQQP